MCARAMATGRGSIEGKERKDRQLENRMEENRIDREPQSIRAHHRTHGRRKYIATKTIIRPLCTREDDPRFAPPCANETRVYKPDLVVTCISFI